jgi:hypothetical protein
MCVLGGKTQQIRPGKGPEDGRASLILSRASLPSADPTLEVSRELASAVSSWYQNHSVKPGYRSGSSYGPAQMRETIEISSALQLPKILAKLHDLDASDIRLQFPQPDPTLRDDQKVAIRNEQTAIHALLRSSHGKPLNQLLNEAKDLIAGSESLKRGKQDGYLPAHMTAEEWIAATVGEKLSQIRTSPQQLAVSDVVEVGSKKISKVRPALEIALRDSVDSSRGLIVTVPNSKHSNKLRDLRDVLRDFVEAKRKSGCTDEQLNRIKVWVGPTKKDLINGPCAGAPCNNVREFSLLDFLRNNPDTQAVLEEPSTGDGGTQEERSAAPPPVAETDAPTTASEIHDPCFQRTK